MKFRCEKDSLSEALFAAARAVSNRTTMAALAGLHLSAQDDQLTVTGTDLDLTIQLSIPVTVTEPGISVIPARLITDIVKSLPASAVTIDTDEREARISAGRSQFVVRVLDPEEFPRLTLVKEVTASLDANALADSLRQVVRAASSDDARPVITGVLLTSNDGGFRLVATDSYRLAVRDIPGADALPSDAAVLVPSKALGELTRLLAGADNVQLALDEREITFIVGETKLTSRLIEGQFPDYKPLIPANYPNALRIDRDVLLEAVRRVKLIVRNATTPVRMALRSDGVELTVVSPDTGQAVEDVEAKYEGDSITVAFNPTYLIDGLEAVAPGEVLIETLDALKPATLKEDANGDFLYLIMPVRVS